MLRAVSTILDSKESVIALSFKAKVDCAKVMLDEIIKSMESGWKSLELADELVKDMPLGKGKLTATQAQSIIDSKPKPPVKAPRPSDKYCVVVGANSALQKIEGLGLEEKVVVDGKPMTHQQAIGKAFTEITLPND